MAGRRFLISVGTSLISKINERIRENQIRGASSTLPLHENDWQLNLELYSNNLQRYIEYIDRINPDDRTNLSAELSSLLKAPNHLKPMKGDHFLLLHTATTMGKVCAHHLAVLLQKIFNNQGHVCCYEVPGLSDAQTQEFYSQGLPKLLAKLQEEIDDAQRNEQEVFLVPTGGYKALIPYFVVVGILHQLPCLYVYEDSNLVASLPPLPLHADMARWSSLEAVVGTLSGKATREAEKSKLYKNYQEILSLLLQEQNGSLQPSPLCQVFQQKVTVERRRSELEFRTHFSPLLEYLIKNDHQGRDDSLKQYFLRLAAIGPHIWKGDRVPEMADHALLHHADLFHLAERLLLPIFYFYEQQNRNNGVFLSPEELFVLLGALHLHDCGHVVGRVDLNNGGQHELLPTEVREYHHVLGYLRLTEPNKHGSTGDWIHNALADCASGTGKAWENAFRKDALEAIATVGLYHRKAMKLKDLSGYQFLPGYSRLATIPCLNSFLLDKTFAINQVALDKERLPLLVCLLRIIDSLDEQASRTGGRESVYFHLQLLENEAREEKERADGLGRVLETLTRDNSRKSGLDNNIGQLVNGYRNRESKGQQKMTGEAGEENKPQNAPSQGAQAQTAYTASSFWEDFNKLFPTNNSLRPLALEYAKARLREEFKQFQKEPYAEKLPIEGLLINHEIKNGFIHFAIDLCLEKNFPNREQLRSKMLESLKKEYEIMENGQPVVKEVLKKHGIILEYGYHTSSHC